MNVSVYEGHGCLVASRSVRSKDYSQMQLPLSLLWSCYCHVVWPSYQHRQGSFLNQ